MTVYRNTIESPDIDAALGTPILTTADEVHVVLGNADYDTNLAGISNAKLVRFLAGKGYGGRIGSGNLGLTINAQLAEIEGSGRSMAFRGKTGETIDRFVWRPAANAAGYLHNATITNLEALASGPLVINDNVTLDNAYIVGNGANAVILGNPSAMTSLHVSGGGGKSTCRTQRDVANIIIGPGGNLLVDTTDVTPSGNIDIRNGLLDYRGGNIGGTLKTDGHCTLDLGKLSASITINAWDVNGLLDIIQPAKGITFTMPSDAQIKGEVRYR